MGKINQSQKVNLMLLIGALLLIIAIFSIFWFFLRGEIKVSGNFPENEVNETLSCRRDNKEYPFFKLQKASRITTEIDIIFKNSTLSSVSLKNFSYYANPSMAIDSWNQNHAAMGTSFGEHGMSGDALSASYFKENNLMRMTLHATANEINPTNAVYFLIENFDLESAPDEFTKYYEAINFNCKIK